MFHILVSVISLVVAASENNAIGKDNRLLWHLPNDLKFFKRHTTGKVIVMGRKTFESVGSRPLPNRVNVVITRNRDFQVPEGVVICYSLQEALDRFDGEPEICIVGGEQIYRDALAYADTVYLTRVHTQVEGDAFFPELGDEWKLESEEAHPADDRHAVAYSFCVYRRG